MADQTTALTPEQIRELLAEANPRALFADGLDAALVGMGRRCGQYALAVYSYSKAVAIFVEQGRSYEDAVEWMEYSVLGPWMGSQGEHAPMWMIDCDDDSPNREFTLVESLRCIRRDVTAGDVPRTFCGVQISIFGVPMSTMSTREFLLPAPGESQPNPCPQCKEALLRDFGDFVKSGG
jgi:hypothetical protein